MKTKKAINMRKLIDICRKNGIAYLAIFGSYARGDFSKKSDLDLLVRFSKEADDAISPYIRKYIKDGLKVVYDEG